MEPAEQMEVVDIMDNSSEALAEGKKELGNQQYKLKEYLKAEAFYSEAINLCPQNASYYGNRAACFMMLNMYDAALEDSVKSVKLDPAFVKGWIRVAKCCIALGDIQAATQALDKVRELEPNNSTLPAELKNLEVLQRFMDEAEKAYNASDFRKVVYCIDRARDVAVACTKLKVLKAECLARLGRYQESQELANEVLAVDKQNADAILVRGMCLYYQENDERASYYFQHVLKLDPDHKKAIEIFKKAKALKQKKEEGNTAFKSGKNIEACTLYTEALKIDPCNSIANAKLFFNRATVQSKLGKLQEAVDDCTEAIKLDPNYLKALLRRAKCFMDLQQFEEAVRDYENAFKMSKCRDVKKLLNDAKIALKNSQRKDYYKILGVEKDASNDDIRKAYRKRALVHHPDRHSHASEEVKKVQEKKFKEVGEAYGILSDPQKRSRYDNGTDTDDMGCGMPGDFNEAFQTFFSNDPSFFTQGFPGNPRFTFHYQ